LDFRGNVPITRIASTGDLNSKAYKLYLAGKYREAGEEALSSLAKKPDSVFQIKLAVDGLRMNVSITEIQKKVVGALFFKGVEHLKTDAGRIGACYVTVILKEIAKCEHKRLDADLSSQLASVANFGAIRFTGNLNSDLIIASFGTHSLSQEVRAILKRDMVAYPNEPFFPACAVEEYTAAYKDGNEVGFKPDWGSDWAFVEKVCDRSITDWPKYPTFYLYKGLAVKRRKDYQGAAAMMIKYRDLIKSRGGSRVFNTDLAIEQLKKLG
jgi:hypothetical protein